MIICSVKCKIKAQAKNYNWDLEKNIVTITQSYYNNDFYDKGRLVDDFFVLHAKTRNVYKCYVGI